MMALYTMCTIDGALLMVAKNELCLLSNSNIDYMGNGISSIDDANRINTGRPFWWSRDNVEKTVKHLLYIQGICL